VWFLLEEERGKKEKERKRKEENQWANSAIV
jgi:hypothetical protein